MTDNTKPTIGEIRTVDDLPLIVTHSAPVTHVTVEAEKTCRTCEHWREYVDGYGRCWASIGPDFPTREALHTRPNFGCNQWHPRPDADARE